MRSVWAIGTPKPSEKEFGKRTTQKPLELLRRIILASTKKGDLILDPFIPPFKKKKSIIKNRFL